MSRTPSTVSPIDEVVAFFVRAPTRAEIAAFRLSESAQRHIHALLNKNAAGTLTHQENDELNKMMVLNEVVSLIRARARGLQDFGGPTD